MLAIRGLNQFYSGSHILWDVDLDVPEGSCTCLMGRNGMGKTTLLKCIMGLLPIRSGSMSYGVAAEAQDLATIGAERRARLGIAYVPQGREIFSQLTVEENLRIGFGARRGEKIKEIPEHIFGWFPVLKKMLRRRGGDLSGGQQQQLAIGRAMVLDPKLLAMRNRGAGEAPFAPDLADGTRNGIKFGLTIGVPALLTLIGVVRWRMREAKRARLSR